MRQERRHACLAAILLAALPGCALPPAEPPTVSALIDTLPADVPRHARTGFTLIVFPPEARPVLDRTQMAYTRQPHQLAWFARHQWAESPPQMLRPLLLRTLEATGAFAAVVAPPHRTAGAVGLRVEITELVQDFSGEAATLRLALRVRVSDEAANRVLATREIAIAQPMREISPDAGVAAANVAMAQALREVAAFVLANLP